MKKIKILAAIAAMLTCLSMFLYLSSRSQATSGANTKLVVVAAKPIVAQTKLTDEMLTLKSMPVGLVHPSAILKKEDVIGKVTKIDIVEQELLLKEKIFEGGETQTGLAFLIPEGMRAVTVMVDKETGVAGLLNRGNFVDVISILPCEATDKQPDKAAGGQQRKASLLFQKIQVLALGGSLSGGDPKESAAMYETVTLALKPQDAVRLVLVTKEGSCQLILRPQNEDGNVKVTDVLVKDIVG